MNKPTQTLRWIAAAALALLVAACGDRSGNSANNAAATGSGKAADAGALRILAGSELKDLQFLQAEMEKAAGTSIQWKYSGTLEMVDQLNDAQTAEANDVVWAASGKYLSLATAGKVKASNKIMLSPVILGVKQSSAKRLGWDRTPPTWGEIAQAAKAGKFAYGMTNPTASNSGFCAVVGVAAALSGNPDGLSAADINSAKLKEFFAGQKLTAGSSGWLADAYAKNPAGLDGLINYESVILSLNTGKQLAEPLVPIYPKEGIITSDYPIMLINPAQRAAYDKLVAFLLSDAVQQRIMAQTHRRPVTAGVKPAAEFGDRLLIELPFPGSLDVLDGLLTAYQNDLRRPGHAWFVLDTSGSMQGERIDALRSGLDALGGGPENSGGSARFTRFALREKVDVITFSSDVKSMDAIDFGDATHYAQSKQQFHQLVGSLSADGGTAIYSTLLYTLRLAGEAQRDEPERFYSVVLMTDGENTNGIDFQNFRRQWQKLGDAKGIRVFPILFGESQADEMKALAEMTGGRTFDGRKESLDKVFREIRGYQ
ncbi:MAG: substrate-binding domain-containing protein [Solimonas sp.]